MLLRLLLPVALVLAGCGRASGEDTSQADRAHRAKEAAEQPPAVNRFTMEHGEFIVMRVPMLISRTLVDWQTCYVWRDAEYRTSSMQCPADGGMEPPDIHQ